MTQQQLHFILSMTLEHCHFSPVLSAKLYCRAVEQLNARPPLDRCSIKYGWPNSTVIYLGRQ